MWRSVLFKLCFLMAEASNVNDRSFAQFSENRQFSKSIPNLFQTCSKFYIVLMGQKRQKVRIFRSAANTILILSGDL